MDEKIQKKFNRIVFLSMSIGFLACFILLYLGNKVDKLEYEVISIKHELDAMKYKIEQLEKNSKSQ